MEEIRNSLINGDCKDVLAELYEKYGEFVDVVYLDPPFFSGTDFDLIWGNGAELAAYTDSGMYTAEHTINEKKFEERVTSAMEKFESGLKGTIDGIDIPHRKIYHDMKEHFRRELREEMQGKVLKGGIANYLEFMRLRLIAIHKVLKPTGTIFLHCDYHANAYLRLMLDEIFGEENFRNDIIWNYRQYAQSSVKGRRFERTFDSILFYSKSEDYIFNPIYGKIRIPLVEASKYGFMNDVGGWFKTAPTGLGTGGYSQEAIDDMDKKGLIHWTRSGNPRKKYYRDSDSNFIYDKKMIGAVWTDILDMMHTSKEERLGYKTQKPERLLERILLASSNMGSVILDPFLGGGTTAVVANRLERRWIGIDVSKRGCLKTIENLTRYGILEDSYTVNFGVAEEWKILDRTAELTKLKWDEMEKLVREVLGFEWTTLCRAYGIDGQHIEDENYFLEVKKWKKVVGQAVVEKLQGKMSRRGAIRGIIVADAFGKGAVKAARDFQELGVDIELKEIESLVREGLL